MKASDFKPDAPRQFGPVARLTSSAVLYGLVWPISRLLIPFNRWPPFPAGPARLAHLQPCEPGQSDVFACSYFKSGTTWLTHVVTQIAWRGRAEFANIFHVVPWLEMPPVLNGKVIPVDTPSPARLSPTGLRAIKTHLAYPDVPRGPEARYIGMVRDPKSVAVSGYHFIRDMALGPTMPPFHAWVRKFLSPDFFEGSWAEHLASWWEHRHEANVLFLNYDDLRADLGAGVDMTAQFMDVALTEEERAAIVERTGFAAMKRDSAKFDPPRMTPFGKENAMVRSGGTKQDRLMTPELARRIDDHCRAELRALGCDFDYDAAFCRS